MHALKKYFEKIIRTKMPRAICTVLFGKLHGANVFFRWFSLISVSTKLYQ